MEKFPDSKKEKDVLNIQSEQDYFDMVFDYALPLGWIKEGDREKLTEKFLKPIYQEYVKIIKELEDENDSEIEINRIIKKLNICLEATRRIGATEPNNIIRTIDDLRRQSGDIYTEYAIASIRIAIADALYNI